MVEWKTRSLADVLGRAPRGVLFTDLDGTVIDFDDYTCPAAVREAVARLADRGIGTVAVTSKTVPEIQRIRDLTDILPLAVAEGGAVLVDLETGERLYPGGGREGLISFLKRLQAAGWPLRGLHEMDAGELSSRTGLPPESANAALQREASEPFVATEPLPPDRLAALQQLVEKAGFRLARGGRLFHLLGPGVDKGTAVRLMMLTFEEQGRLATAACGDAWNDVPMLCAVDHGFLLGDVVDPSELPCRVERIHRRGPEGFVEAALRVADLLAPGPGV